MSGGHGVHHARRDPMVISSPVLRRRGGGGQQTEQLLSDGQPHAWSHGVNEYSGRQNLPFGQQSRGLTCDHERPSSGRHHDGPETDPQAKAYRFMRSAASCGSQLAFHTNEFQLPVGTLKGVNAVWSICTTLSPNRVMVTFTHTGTVCRKQDCHRRTLSR